MTASSLDSSAVELRTAGDAVVPAAVSYNAATLTVTLDPAADLPQRHLYRHHQGRHRRPARQGRRRQRPRRQCLLDLHDRRVPLHDLALVHDARCTGWRGHERGAGRREVPNGRRRTGHRRSLLQGSGEHGHARRQPVDRRRSPARIRHLRRRNNERLAGSGLCHAHHRRAQHGLCRLLLRTERALRVRRRVLRLSGEQRTASCAVEHDQPQRRVRVRQLADGLSELVVQRRQLLGGRRVPGPAGHDAAGGLRIPAGIRCNRCDDGCQRRCDVQRASDPGLGLDKHVRAPRTWQCARRIDRVVRRGYPHRHPDTVGRAGVRASTPRRSSAGRPIRGSKTPPAMPSRRMSAGRSRRLSRRPQ